MKTQPKRQTEGQKLAAARKAGKRSSSVTKGKFSVPHRYYKKTVL